jgi:S-adenosylhomocysteine hydrolase
MTRLLNLTFGCKESAVDAVRRATDIMLAGKEWLYVDMVM